MPLPSPTPPIPSYNKSKIGLPKKGARGIMHWLHQMRPNKLHSFTILLVTLSSSIVIGTILNTGVHAAKAQQSIARDATPLVVPNAVQLGNEFTKLAKRLEPSVVYITADFTPKVADNPHKREQPQE